MSNPNNESWKKKAKSLFQTCESEFRRTTAIGMKMLHASKTSTDLHESFEELGQLVFQAIKTGELNWEHPRARQLVEQITQLDETLKEMEVQVQELKKEE
jgi:hypothetical protein